jgi:hypothetical protein
MCSRALSAGSFTVSGPLRTKKSPSASVSIPFQRRNTGSGLRWQATRQTVLPSTIWVRGSMQVPARSAEGVAHRRGVARDLSRRRTFDREELDVTHPEISWSAGSDRPAGDSSPFPAGRPVPLEVVSLANRGERRLGEAANLADDHGEIPIDAGQAPLAEERSPAQPLRRESSVHALRAKLAGRLGNVRLR